MPDEALTLERPLHRRVRRGLRHPQNWYQLVRFGVVGASGFVVNLGVYALLVHVFGAPYLLAAVASFLAAVTNNFLWNRRYTFRVRHGRRRFQAVRFLIVSVGAFTFSLAALALLVEVGGMPKVPAQAVAILVALPLNFLGQKLWSFRR